MNLKDSLEAAVGCVGRWLTRGRVRILMYHRFGTAGMQRRLDVREFDEHVRYIAKNFAPRRLDDVVARLHAGQPPEDRTVVITVDDGYADFYEHAYPVLRRHRVPATVYLVSDFVEQRLWLWFDAIRFLIDSAPLETHRVTVGDRVEDVILTDAQQKHALWGKITDQCLKVAPDRQQEIISRLERELNVSLPPAPVDDFRAMTWEQVRDMDPELIEIGAHTVTHPILSHCSVDRQRQEIEGSKLAIETRLGRPVKAFCYPNGLPRDFSTETTRIVREAGFTSAVVAHGGFVAREPDLYRLERASADETRLFRNCVNGLWHLRARANARLGRFSPA